TPEPAPVLTPEPDRPGPAETPGGGLPRWVWLGGLIIIMVVILVILRDA
ncbi:MAG: hypothetical protein HQ502_14425, partial [Alphaproteobacteria bacterium]|nr:hypothetical protein [Alphaproteobacteria bacterium]